MKLIVFAMAASVLLTVDGCTTFGTPSPAELAQVQASDDAECVSYGFEPDTESFAECRLHLADRRHADQQQSREEFAASMRQLSANMQASRPVTCNTTSFGTVGPIYNRSATTTCY